MTNNQIIFKVIDFMPNLARLDKDGYTPFASLYN